MVEPDIPINESERLRALQSYQIIDTLPEKEYDDLTSIAAGIAGTEISLVSLITEDRQWFKSHHGIDATETPRNIAFCAHAINRPHEFLEVENAIHDNRFHDNPLVTSGPEIRYYGGVPLVDSNGMALGTLCVIDSKPMKLTETQIDLLKKVGSQVISQFNLRKKNLEVQEQLERKELLFKILSHDLKGPIGSYSVLIQLVLEDIGDLIADPNKREYYCNILKSIDKSSNSAYELILSILEWTSQAQSGLNHESEIFSIREVVNMSVDIQEQLADRKNISLKIVCENDYKINSNKKILATIIRNLIGNSVKFTQEAGKIIIECNQNKDGSSTIAVIDNGMGIPKERLDYIRNVESSNISRGTSNEIGYGLGLKVCNSLAEEINAKILIDSVEGEGTTVTLVLPPQS